MSSLHTAIDWGNFEARRFITASRISRHIASTGQIELAFIAQHLSVPIEKVRAWAQTVTPKTPISDLIGSLERIV